MCFLFDVSVIPCLAHFALWLALFFVFMSLGVLVSAESFDFKRILSLW